MSDPNILTNPGYQHALNKAFKSAMESFGMGIDTVNFNFAQLLVTSGDITYQIANIDGTYTPEIDDGLNIFSLLNGNVTISLPVSDSPFPIGQVFSIIFVQNSTGYFTVTFNGYKNTLNYQPRQGPGQYGAVQFQYDGTNWILVHSIGIDSSKPFNMLDFGAKGTGVVSDWPAIEAARLMAVAKGGGTLYFPNTGFLYGIDQSIVHGISYVNMADVALTPLGYPNATGYSSQLASSFNNTNYLANFDIPHVTFEFETGAGLGWIGSAPSVETPMIHYAAQPDGEGPPSGNAKNGFIRGGIFCGPDQISGGRYAPALETNEPTTNVSGIFVPGTSQLKVLSNSIYGVKRGIVASDNYWGLVADNQIFRSIDGITVFDQNAALLFENVITACFSNAYIATGQGVRIVGNHTEGAPTAINIPIADDIYIGHNYLESTASSDTDYYIKLGQNASGNNITWAVIENTTMIPGVNAGTILMKSCIGVQFRGWRTRFNNLTHNVARIDNAQCFDIQFDGTNIPLDSFSVTNFLQNCSFKDASYDAGANFITQTGSFAKFQQSNIYPSTGGSAITVHGGLTVTGEEITQAARRGSFRFINGGTTNLDATYETVFVNGNAGAATINLPVASSCPGRAYILIRDDQSSSNNATINAAGGEDIIYPSGSNLVTASYVLGQLQTIRLVSNGAGFWLAETLEWGRTAPNFLGNLNVDGTLVTKGSRTIHTSTVTSNVTLDGTYEYVTANTNGANNINITLPTSTSVAGREYFLQRGGANDGGFTVTVLCSGSDSLHTGATSQTSLIIPYGNTIKVFADGGTIWYSEYSSTGGGGGSVTFASAGTSPNAAGGSVSGSTIQLQPADETNPGLLTAVAQSIGGTKTFNDGIDTSQITTIGDTSLGLNSTKVDATSALGGFFDVLNGLTDSGVIWEWRNAGTMKANIDQDGSFTGWNVTLSGGHLWNVNTIHFQDSTTLSTASTLPSSFSDVGLRTPAEVESDTVILYKFDDSTGTTWIDSGAGSINLTANSSLNSVFGPQGLNSKGIELTGSNGMVSSAIGNTNTFLLSQSAWTLGFWIFPQWDITQDAQLTLCKGLAPGPGNDDDIQLLYLTYDLANQRMQSASWQTDASGPTTLNMPVGSMPLGQWTYIEISRSTPVSLNANYTICANGRVVATNTVAVATHIPVGAHWIWIGGYQSANSSTGPNTHFAHADMQGWELHNTARTPAQALTAFLKGRP